MADRILGMGDIVTLVEQAQEKMDLEESEAAAKRLMEGNFTMDDMLVQFEQISKMGPLGGILKMLPGMNQYADMINEADAEKGMKLQKAIIQSMTKEEREDPSILNNRRKNRIAKGSGTSVQEVSKVVNQFEKMSKLMKQMGSMSKAGKMPNFGGMFGKK
jgi:signal recognition particle subunit SRP54